MKLTKKQAKELSIKKWEYIVGNRGSEIGLIDKYSELEDLTAYCGYCEKYHSLDCRNCPINLGFKYNNGSVCCNKSHPWLKWNRNSTKANAQKVLDLIKQS